jgi:hypothetical protein
MAGASVSQGVECQAQCLAIIYRASPGRLAAAFLCCGVFFVGGGGG